MLHAIIMAGGSGTRFWPKSRRDRPKQLLNLFGDATMLQQTVARIKPLVPSERILIVTGADQAEQTRATKRALLGIIVGPAPLPANARRLARSCKSCIFRAFSSSGRRVSNPRPSAWEADALPTELRPQVGGDASDFVPRRSGMKAPGSRPSDPGAAVEPAPGWQGEA